MARADAAIADDPILAAIERHKEAWHSFEVANQLTDAVLAEQEGRAVTQDDENVYEEANNREIAVLASLLITVPQTKAGARAAIEYLIKYDYGCEPRSTAAFAKTLLLSPVFANLEA